MIQNLVGGDMHLVETAEPYSDNFDSVVDQNHDEMDEGTLPELKDSDLELSQYDTVFIGYPIWATTAPQNETLISITIGDEMLEGVIYDTALAAEFREKFPLTVSMAIFYAQTDNPDLTMEVIPVGRVTLDLSVFEELPGNVDITFELAE